MSDTRISIQTFGCRVNQYESEMMRDRLSSAYRVTDESPNLILLNACTVTALAERKARQAARRLRRENPNARVILVGCLADAVNQGTTQFPDADLLAGNSWKTHINDLIEYALAGTCGMLPSSSLDELSVERSSGPHSRIRAFLKIQDGCSRACTYCRTTQVRGKPRSKRIKSIRAEAQTLISNGFPEIALTGIDLAQYAANGDRLVDAVQAITSLNGLLRLRLASINPSGITRQLVEACASLDNVCPHFHIPLQSGDHDILRAMKRGYTIDGYLEAINLIRSRIPHATFGTDMIVGFPGEDESAFSNTLAALDTVGYINLHAFRYSPRRGTEAAKFVHQVSSQTKQERSARLIEHWRDRLAPLLDKRINTIQDVLVEECRDTVWRGYTHDYLYVTFSSDRQIPIGSLLPVRIVGRTGAILQGVEDHRTEAN